MSDRTKPELHSRFDFMIPMKPAVMVATFLILAWLLFMLYETTNMMPPILPGYPGDAFFPRLVLIYGIVCAAFILVRGLLLRRGAPMTAGETPAFAIHVPEFAWVCVLVIAYGELLTPVGFEITTFVVMMALLAPRIRAGGCGVGRSLVYALTLSLTTTFVFYVAFALLLRIPLPLLFLPRYIQY